MKNVPEEKKTEEKDTPEKRKKTQTQRGKRKREETKGSDTQEQKHTHRNQSKIKFKTVESRDRGSIEKFLVRQDPSVAAKNETPSGDSQLGGTQYSKTSYYCNVKSKSGGNPKGSGRGKFSKHLVPNNILSYLKPIHKQGLEKEP